MWKQDISENPKMLFGNSEKKIRKCFLEILKKPRGGNMAKNELEVFGVAKTFSEILKKPRNC